jgi:hypothetical protein
MLPSKTSAGSYDQIFPKGRVNAERHQRINPNVVENKATRLHREEFHRNNERR